MRHDKIVICWWSGGVTSAVACWLAIKMFGLQNVRVIFIDTFNESKDTYRFMRDCELWYGCKIEVISAIGGEYKSIKDVWFKYLSLNVSTGAICSSVLKRDVRLKFERNNYFDYQVFGYDMSEPKRARSMTMNHPGSKPIYTLLLFGYTKKKCIEIIDEFGIQIPVSYKDGFSNNNCEETGCVQGGIGYWQMRKEKTPEKFFAMAKIEHDLTNLKGTPVTMLKDQGKNGGLVFLLPHPKYPEIKDISMMKGRPPKPIFECNGFCGVNDLEKRSPTEKEINYSK